MPTLKELPQVVGRTGWPWTDETPPNDEAGANWPRITLVTPSYNQGQYLEETIRSVLLQGYPNLEYVVMDGGSSDASSSIIKKYAPWLSYWVSEKDGGQAAAINTAFARASGQILGWVNSDDALLPNALFTVARKFLQNPQWQLLFGEGYFIDDSSKVLERCYWVRPWNPEQFLTQDSILQPAAFWRAELWAQTGPLDTHYHWGFDWDWFIRASRFVQPQQLSDYLALARITADTKTSSGGARRQAEIAKIARQHGGFGQPTNLVYVARKMGDAIAQWVAWAPDFIRRRVQRRAYWLYNSLKARYPGLYME